MSLDSTKDLSNLSIEIIAISLHVFVMIWTVFTFRIIDRCDVSKQNIVIKICKKAAGAKQIQNAPLS